MSVNEIGGSVLDSLQTYADTTETGDDDAYLKTLTQLILDAVPGIDASEVGEKIAEIQQQNPSWTMDEVFAAAVKAFNPACSDSTIAAIKDAWEDFTGVSDLSSDDIIEILDDAKTFAANQSTGTDSETGSTSAHASLRDALAEIRLILVELLGKESAAMLAQGMAERENIMALGERQAQDILDKATWEAIGGFSSAGLQIAGSLGSAAVGTVGLSAATQGLNGISQAMAGLGSSVEGFHNGLSTVVTTFTSIFSAAKEADMALVDAEKQAAGMRKDTADQLRQSALKVIEGVFSLEKAVGQYDYQTKTAIGRA